jgi:hypothetical protein
MCSSVRRLAWDDRTNTTAGLIDIPRPARDQMDMAVHDGLTRRLAAVHANVEALDRCVGSEHVQSHLIENEIDGAPLGLVKVEIGGCVTPGDDQRVQWRDRVGIVEREGDSFCAMIGRCPGLQRKHSDNPSPMRAFSCELLPSTVMSLCQRSVIITAPP